MASQVKSLSTTKLDNSLDITDLTHLALNGNGVLDKFLTLHRLVLDREFNEGRILGKEYSDSFVATYTINMELAIKFLSEKEKQFYEIEILESQKHQSDLQNELLASQIVEQEYKNTNHLPLETLGLSLRNDNLEKDLLLKDSQISNSLKDLELKDYELRFIKPQELAIKASQLAIAEKELLLKAKQLELAEYELLHKLPAEVEGIEANTELTEQKIITEKAQTDNSVIGEGSVIGWNINVLEAQVKGIDQDAKQKIMRMLIDTWTTRMNNDSAETEPAGLGDSVIAATVQAAKDSVGI